MDRDLKLNARELRNILDTAIAFARAEDRRMTRGDLLKASSRALKFLSELSHKLI
jgi:hypothetical protein